MTVLSKIKDLKQQYRDQFSELQMIKSEVDYTQQLVSTCTQETLEDFRKWFAQEYGVAPNASPATLELDGGEGGWEGGDGPLSPSAASTVSAGPAASVISAASSSVSGAAAAQRLRMGGGPASTGSAAATAAGHRSPAPAGVAPVRANPSPVKKTAAAPRPKPVLPKPEPGELQDPEAAAFYAAQQKMLERTTGVAHRPGSCKKRMGQDLGFSTTARADPTAKVSADVFMKANNPKR